MMKTTEIHEPWSGAVVGQVELADASRADGAVRAVERGFDAMRALSSADRKKILRRVARSIEDDADGFATLLAREAGKPIAQARGEVARAVSTFDIASEEATRVGGEVMPLDVTDAARGARGYWTRVPAGPVLAIAPFNFPLNLVAHKVAPALACGCSVLLKPAPQTPLTSLRLAHAVRAAGAPDGAFVVVTCENDVAESLVRDERFATLSFTGSGKVGWHLKSISGKKRVLLELGGNAAAIVHEDAAVDRALDKIVAGAFAYAGQVCIKVQRVYVHEPIADAFMRRLAERAGALATRDPLDPEAVLGSMIDEANAIRVERWVDEARGAGARLLAGGHRHGARFEATVLAIEGDGAGLKVVDEEVFGPVATVHRYATWDDALRMANATRYGLQAGVFTDSHARIRDAFDRLRVGGLIVNDVPTFRVDNMPYGGVRDSGFGREGVRFAIDEMTEKKLFVDRS